MEAVAAAASLVALIEIAAKVTLLCVQYGAAVKNANKDIESLKNETKTLVDVLEHAQKLCNGPRGSELFKSNKVLQSISDCSAQLGKLHDDLKPKERSKLASALKLDELRWPLDSKQVLKIINDFERYKSTLSLSFQLDQIAILQDKFGALILDRLPTADDAAFDSYTNQFQPQCHKETRLKLLQQIRDWINGSTGEHIFWLSGAAGSGKSTIARTIAKESSDEAILHGSFFFKRGEGDRGNGSQLVTTLASQMAQSMKSLRSALGKALEDDPKLATKSMRKQFDKLVAEPLKTLPTTRQKPLVFVIDAMDECDKLEQIELFIQLVAETQTTVDLPLRFFLTSRPELPIRDAFKQISKNSCQPTVLHDVDPSIVRSDIEEYLADEMAQILLRSQGSLPTDWPGKKDFQRLVDIAEPLFISAATIARFIGERRLEPKGQLEIILGYHHLGSTSQLETTYQPVLDSMLFNLTAAQKEKIIKDFQNIVGSIIVAADSLSIASLSSILSADKSSIRIRLNSLHSVLRIPNDDDDLSPVRLFHLSFRDYLVDSSRGSNVFVIDEANSHRQLANGCLRLLSKPGCLKQDICDLQKLGTARMDVSQSIIENAIPPDVAYACRYLVHHLDKGACPISSSSALREFLKTHFLHWIEALSLMGRVEEMTQMIRCLQTMAENEHDDELDKILRDMKDFFSDNSDIADTHPLQVYSSGAWFAPKTSIFAMSPETHRKKPFGLLPRISQEAWERDRGPSQGNTDEVTAFTFSGDLTLAASGSADCTIMIWNIANGSILHRLRSHCDTVQIVYFFSHGLFLASVCRLNLMKLWDMKTGDLMKTFQLDKDGVNLQDITGFTVNHKDGSFLLVDRSCTINNLEYNGSDLEVRYSVRLPKDNCRSMANKFSPSGELFVSVFQSKSTCLEVLLLCNAATGIILKLFDEDEAWSDWAFNQDDDLLYVVGDDGLCKIPRNTTDPIVIEIPRTGTILTLSSSGEFLASRDDEQSISIWHVPTQSLRATCKNTPEGLEGALFSKDDESFGAHSPSGTFMIWKTETGTLQSSIPCSLDPYIPLDAYISGGRLAVHTYRDAIWTACIQSPHDIVYYRLRCDSDDSLRNLTFSSNGQCLISYSWDDQSIVLWDISHGFAETRITHNGCRLYGARTSPTDNTLVTVARDESSCSVVMYALPDERPSWIYTLADRDASELKGDVPGLRISPDGKKIVVFHNKMGFVVLATDGQMLTTVSSSLITFDDQIDFSPDSRYVMAATMEAGVWLFNAISGVLEAKLDQFDLTSSQASEVSLYCSQGSNGVALSLMQGMGIVNLDSNPIIPPEIDSLGERPIAFSPDGHRLLTNVDGNGPELRLWNLVSQTVERSLKIDVYLPTDYAMSLGDDFRIQTHWGVLGFDPLNSKQSKHDRSDIYISYEWVYVNMERILWLPLKYRANAVAAHEGKLAMAFRSGRILLFDPDAESERGRNRWFTFQQRPDESWF